MAQQLLLTLCTQRSHDRCVWSAKRHNPLLLSTRPPLCNITGLHFLAELLRFLPLLNNITHRLVVSWCCYLFLVVASLLVLPSVMYLPVGTSWSSQVKMKLPGVVRPMCLSRKDGVFLNGKKPIKILTMRNSSTLSKSKYCCGTPVTVSALTMS
ncbi:uncharacterized protein LOC143805328 [Ranitomeya variabilis]|uniref:uncharacterized protein LOC143805328 n=1 Tax=Ranitomeya variabilis TaxID=490064 RepID=UPI00405659D5